MMFPIANNPHFVVMAGLDPAIYEEKTWMPGTRPGKTVGMVAALIGGAGE